MLIKHFLLLLVPFYGAFLRSASAQPQILQAVESSARLPSARIFVPAVEDGADYIYLIGGYHVSEIMRFSISNDSLETIGSVPGQLAVGGVTRVGHSDIFFCGGMLGHSVDTSDIWGVRIQDDGVGADMSIVGSLPRPHSFSSAAWDGEDGVYVAGGYEAATATPLSTIVRYSLRNQSTGGVAELPTPRYSMASVWDESKGQLLLIGGSEGSASGPYLDEIVTYDPWSGSIAMHPSRLPHGLMFSCAVWTGSDVYLVGGWSALGRGAPSLVRFSPKTGALSALEVDGLAGGLNAVGCAYVRRLQRLYVFGGRIGIETSGSPSRDQILHIDLTDVGKQ